MKNSKRLIKILSVFIILLLISITSYALYFYLMLNYDEQISERLTKDVIVINDLFVSMYIVKTDSGYIAIDTGFNEAFIEKGLAYNNITTDQIKYVFLTHSDPDHVNNVHLFNNAEIVFSKKEYEMLEKEGQRFLFIPYYSNKPDLTNFTIAKEGDKFELADINVELISLPGHTEGSTGFIIKGKYLFSGDAFRLKNGKISIPFKKLFTRDESAMRETIHIVSQLEGIEYIFTAHSGFTADFNFATTKTNVSFTKK